MLCVLSLLKEESILALEKFPTPASRLALTDILEQEQCFYKVRMQACFCLSRVCVYAHVWDLFCVCLYFSSNAALIYYKKNSKRVRVGTFLNECHNHCTTHIWENSGQNVQKRSKTSSWSVKKSYDSTFL